MLISETIQNLLFINIAADPEDFFNRFKNNFKPEEIPDDEESGEETITKTKYNERDLHPLLVKFANAAPNFKAYVKTIYHEEAKHEKKGLNKWLYPDLVGVHLPFLDFDHSTLQVQRIVLDRS